MTPIPQADGSRTVVAAKPASLRKKLLLVAFGLVVGLVVAEGAIRVWSAFADQQRVVAWEEFVSQRRGGAASTGATDALGDIIRPSSIPGVVYRLAPGLDLEFKGGALTTNEDGFRGPSIPREKAPDALRVVALGDSVMFGTGVNDDEGFLRVTESTVNRSAGSRRLEIVNTAVPGYNTSMEVAVLEHLGLEWQPDVVWIDFVGNDFGLPNFIAVHRDHWALDRSFLADWVQAQFRENEDPFQPLRTAPRSANQRGFEYDPDLVPEEYRHMVGYDGYRRAMKRLAELASEHGFTVVVTHHVPAHDVVAAVCREFDFVLISGRDPVVAWMKDHQISEYLGSVLTVSATDPHPSALQHRILGEYYARLLTQSGAFR